MYKKETNKEHHYVYLKIQEHLKWSCSLYRKYYNIN